MGFFSRLFGGGGARQSAGGSILWLYVRCNRCGEKIRIRLNRSTDAQPEYDDGGRLLHYLIRKEILGSSGTCFALMSVEMQLDGAGRILSQEPQGCTIISEDEFNKPDDEVAERSGQSTP